MRRLIFTVAMGGPKYAAMALGLGRSLRLLGESIETALYTNIPGDWERVFDKVIPAEAPRSPLDKLRALDLSDSDAVVALDCDSLAFRRLGPVFDACAGKPFAVQGDYHDAGRWHGAEVANVCRRLGVPALPRFNGGFLYYERRPETFRLLASTRKFEGDYADTGFDLFRGAASDEVCVLLAMLETAIGEVIPDEADFMSTAVGLIGPLRMNVARAECSFLCRREKVRWIRPYIFHAALLELPHLLAAA